MAKLYQILGEKLGFFHHPASKVEFFNPLVLRLNARCRSTISTAAEKTGLLKTSSNTRRTSAAIAISWPTTSSPPRTCTGPRIVSN